MRISREVYSYRSDPAIPSFPDDYSIIVFDGYCPLCSGWAKLVVRHDHGSRYRLLSAQSPLGRALYQHYGLDLRDYETNILLAGGTASFKSEACIRMLEGLGLPWSLASLFRLLPLAVRDRAYDIIARNRFRFLGKRDACFVPGPEIKERFLA